MLRVRVGKAVLELDYEARFDIVLVNDVLSNALSNAEQLVSDFLK
jgi:guanylate kinase